MMQISRKDSMYGHTSLVPGYKSSEGWPSWLFSFVCLKPIDDKVVGHVDFVLLYLFPSIRLDIGSL